MTQSDQLEVRLHVPVLSRAIDFYSTLLDVRPQARERRLAWFDVPDSPLRLELRETSTLTPTRLRICVEASRLRAASARLRRAGVRAAESGLRADGHPQAIAVSDPGGNRLELGAPLVPVQESRTRPIGAGRLFRSGGGAVRLLLTAGPVHARFDQARAQDQMMVLRPGRRG